MNNDLKLLGESFSMWKFADDTTVSEVVSIFGESSLQEAVNHISSWSHNDLFQVNPTKGKKIVVCFKKTPPYHGTIKIDSVQFDRVSSAKVLEVTIGYDLKWNDHGDTITSKASKSIVSFESAKESRHKPR